MKNNNFYMLFKSQQSKKKYVRCLITLKFYNKNLNFLNELQIELTPTKNLECLNLKITNLPFGDSSNMPRGHMFYHTFVSFEKNNYCRFFFYMNYTRYSTNVLFLCT